MHSINQQAIHYQSRHRRQSIWRKIVTVLASVVVFCTTYALILPAITMETQPVCGKEVHIHGEECYALPEAAEVFRLVCTPENLGLHVHGTDCYGAEGELLCGLAEFVLHRHDNACYDQSGTLICPLPEMAAHMHEEACWTQPHVHGEGCYTPQQGQLLCPVEEGSIHVHGDGCYTPKTTLICTQAEVPAHTHDEACFAELSEQTCTLEESEEHTHGEACFAKTRQQICTLEETPGHTHGEGCMLTEQQLTCLLSDTEAHVHETACYEQIPVLSCTQLTAEQGALPQLTCQKPEISLHTHDDACLTEGAVTCGLLQVDEHSHGERCFTLELVQPETPVCICGVEAHEHTEDCYPSQQEQPSPQPTPDTPAPDTRLCGLEEHIHVESCADENGVILCTMPVHTHDFRCDLAPSDPTAVETADTWQATLPTLTGLPAADLLAVANSQLAYQENTANYILTETSVQYYNRYAAWWNEQQPYAPMDAVFAAFCVNYAGVQLPLNGEADLWLEDLAYGGWLIPAGESPTPADLVFLTDGRVGIVNQVTDTGFSAYLPQNGRVTLRNLSLSGALAFARIPGNLPAELPDPQVEAVAGLMAQLPPAEEMRLQWWQATASGDEEARQMIRAWLAEQILPVQELYDELTAEQQAKVDPAPLSDLVALMMEMDRPLETTTVEGEKDFVYEDESLSLSLQVSGWLEQTVLPDMGIMPLALDYEQPAQPEPWAGLTLVAEPLDSTSTASRRAAAYVQQQNGGQPVDVTALQFRFMNGDQPVDTTGWNIQATITPKQELVAPALASLAQQNAAPEAETGVVLSALQVQGTQVTTLDEALMQPTDAVPALTFALAEDGVVAVTASHTANPNFTVQYYAYVEKLNTSGSNPLPLINTDNGGNNQRGNLPKNGVTPATKDLYLELVSGTTYRVATNKNTLSKVYQTKSDYEYIHAPNLTYFNRLYENGHYTLKEVWILKEGKSAESVTKSDWDVYTDPNGLHFTNRPQSAQQDNTILIEDNDVIRLVFDTTTGSYTNKANFYDYDITNGKFYKSASTTGGTYSTQAEAGNNTVYGYTNQQGINSGGNYSGSGTKLAFGNSNTDTGLQDLSWGSNTPNKGNGNGYKGCTFGLVTGLDASGNIQYASDIQAPSLFNESTATGKTTFEDQNLNFTRDGDTYTLSSVSGTAANVSDLQNFTHITRYGPGTDNYKCNIFTNFFWPMDTASTFGAPGHDLKFGHYGNRLKRKYFGNSSYSFPTVDENVKQDRDHNAYFGMHYAVEFKLTADYVGPLEYYFFGDDDMWVFLDGELVCDIGGVHSSVGQYVNLWDYLDINTDAGTHKLSFYYTERGASGSSCYMRFTLPSVSSVTPEQNTGTLRVEKEVTGVIDPNAEFNFFVHFTDANGNNLRDDYAYNRYDAEGNLIKQDLIIYEGGTFQLRHGEYIVIRYLPIGTRYTVTEDPAPGYITGVRVNHYGKTEKTNTVSGVIQKQTEDALRFINQAGMELPQTGGMGAERLVSVGLGLSACAASAIVLIYHPPRKRGRKGAK